MGGMADEPRYHQLQVLNKTLLQRLRGRKSMLHINLHFTLGPSISLELLVRAGKGLYIILCTAHNETHTHTLTHIILIENTSWIIGQHLLLNERHPSTDPHIISSQNTQIRSELNTQLHSHRHRYTLLCNE